MRFGFILILDQFFNDSSSQLSNILALALSSLDRRRRDFGRF